MSVFQIDLPDSTAARVRLWVDRDIARQTIEFHFSIAQETFRRLSCRRDCEQFVDSLMTQLGDGVIEAWCHDA